MFRTAHSHSALGAFCIRESLLCRLGADALRFSNFVVRCASLHSLKVLEFHVLFLKRRSSSGFLLKARASKNAVGKLRNLPSIRWSLPHVPTARRARENAAHWISPSCEHHSRSLFNRSDHSYVERVRA